MSRTPCCPERGLSLSIRASLAVLAWCSVAQPASSASGDPIARIARVISNDLVRIANSAFVTRERKSNGQVILFATSPTFRGATKGTARILMNAMIYGPGFGADHPIQP